MTTLRNVRSTLEQIFHIQRNKTKSKIPLVITYNLRNPNVTPTVNHPNEVVKTYETFSNIFEKKKRNVLTVKDNQRI